MVRRKYLVTVLLTALFTLPSTSQTGSVPATDTCASSLFSNANSDRNLFNPQQEEWLGEIMDQGMRKDFHVIEDSDGYLQRMGERLLAQLPPTKIHYRFVIVDSPGLNSFGLVGGRIYIYRRMIAFAKSEDELASLVGHEIGHMITHQYAIEVSDWFRELGITSVGDRQDVFDKWNRFKDNARKIKGRTTAGSAQEGQMIADRIGLYAMMRAGYDPAHFAEFADRSFETKGKTGNFLTDLFGATTPESKRLREIRRQAAPLPATCIAARADTSGFARWQQSIVEARQEVAKEELPGLMQKVALQPPLRNELSYLQFSPDGKYLLAQDDSSIFLLAREPLANLFTIDAPGANLAQFTPDSTAVVFDDEELRVQKWDIAGQRQVFIRELSSNCANEALSPSGEVMACMKRDRELQLVDVKTGDVFFSKKNFFELTQSNLFFAELLESLGVPGALATLYTAVLRFSPDGHYFLGAHGNYSLAYDLTARAEVKIQGKARTLARSNFVFIAPDEIFGVDGQLPQKALRVRFPSGEVIDQFPFTGRGQFSPVIKANYVMVRPAGMAAIGAIDLSAQKVTMGYKTVGFAIYDKIYAGDDVDGLLKTYNLSDKSQIAQVQLPKSALARTKATAFSSNGKWLAVSGRSRGAVWKVETGEQVGISGDFDGAFFDQEVLIAKFPKHLKDPERMVAITTSPVAASRLYALESEEDDSSSPGAARTPRARTWQDEDLLVRIAPTDPKKFDHFQLEMRDARTNSPLWQIPFDRPRPSFYYLSSGKTITFVVGDYDAIKAAARQDPALAARMDAIKGKQGKQASYLIQVYEARSRKPLGRLLVDTGNLSFLVRAALTAGDTVLVSDSLHRTLVYSLKSGEQRGKVFGNPAAVSSAGDRMLVENGKGAADLYDTTSLQSLAHFVFPSRVARAEFIAQDKLMVLTTDQTCYQFNLTTMQQNAGAH
jgi:WD40 repeat protein